MDGIVFLEKNVRMIMLKFNFSNPNVIPPWVRRFGSKNSGGAVVSQEPFRRRVGY